MITVESGAIIAGACSYVSVIDCDQYHADRNVTAWAAADTASKEAALRKSAAYLDGHYRSRWLGSRVAPITQPLMWPRYGVQLETASSVIGGVYYGGVPINNYLLSTTIPQRVKDAQCELALLELATPGVLSPALASSVQSEKLDVIETAYKNGAKKGQIEYPAIDQLLSDYLKPLGSGTVQRG
jgi:hypothetical protein